MQKFLWTLVDVGGQRVERRKWIHSQQGLNGVLYFAALDDYDVPSDESEDQTRMKDSLDVWSEVCVRIYGLFRATSALTL
jgi:hypothetical protein